MRHIKFIIGSIEAIGNREALVGGRCCGTEIRRGGSSDRDDEI